MFSDDQVRWLCQIRVYQLQDTMIYPLVGATAGLGLFLYNNHIATPASAPQTTNTDLLPKDTFSPSTIANYLQLRSEKDRFVLYSNLHKQPLATHHLITKANANSLQKIQALKKDEVNVQQKEVQLKNNGSSLSDVEASSSETESSVEIQNSAVINRNQSIYQRFFRSYAQELISSNKCQSVELIEGPIFSKDTPYKVKNSEGKYEKVDQVYTSFINISQSGEYLTDRFYTIVICNQGDRHFINGFTMRRFYGSPVFDLTRYLTSLIKIQEQTGLTFNVKGQYLTLIDYDNIKKERKYADYETQQ